MPQQVPRPVTERRLRSLAELVRHRPPAAGSTRVVALDGRSGSGKTTLAGRLAPLLGDVPVLHLDDLYPGWDGLEQAPVRLREWVLEPLAAGRPARYRRWDWAAGEYAEWHDVPAGGVLVVEGVGSGAAACAPYLTALVWLEAPRELRFARGIARDGEAYRPHWERWAAQEDAYLARDRPRDRADVLLSTGPDAA